MRTAWPKSIEKVNLIEFQRECREQDRLLDSTILTILSSCFCLHNMIHLNMSNIVLDAFMSLELKKDN